MVEDLDPSVPTDEIHSEYKYPFNWDIDFSLNIGETNKRFFDAMKEKKILGTRCSESGELYVPPQSVCLQSYTEPDEWVEVEQRGVVESYTVCFFEFEGMPEPPYITAAIRVADSAITLLHFVDGIEYDEPEDLIGSIGKGTEVEPVWVDDPEGHILDIKYWQPIE